MPFRGTENVSQNAHSGSCKDYGRLKAESFDELPGQHSSAGPCLRARSTHPHSVRACAEMEVCRMTCFLFPRSQCQEGTPY